MTSFITEWNARIAEAKATNDTITITNTFMDCQDAFNEADNGSDSMHFFNIDIIQEFFNA